MPEQLTEKELKEIVARLKKDVDHIKADIKKIEDYFDWNKVGTQVVRQNMIIREEEEA